MKHIELLSTEQDFFRRLTADEKKIYLASDKQLAAIATWNDQHVQEYVTTARLLNELHRLHSRYNDDTETLVSMSNVGEQQIEYDKQYLKNEELFTTRIQIGDASKTVYLSCMNDADALYECLAKMKMNAFEVLTDYFETAVLIETLVSHEVY